MVSSYFKVGCTSTAKVSVRPSEPVETPLGKMWLFTPKEARDFAAKLTAKAEEAERLQIELQPQPPPRKRHIRDLEEFERKMLGEK